jgi:hypothetical protein
MCDRLSWVRRDPGMRKGVLNRQRTNRLLEVFLTDKGDGWLICRYQANQNRDHRLAGQPAGGRESRQAVYE